MWDSRLGQQNLECYCHFSHTFFWPYIHTEGRVYKNWLCFKSASSAWQFLQSLPRGEQWCCVHRFTIPHCHLYSNVTWDDISSSWAQVLPGRFLGPRSTLALSFFLVQLLTFTCLTQQSHTEPGVGCSDCQQLSFSEALLSRNPFKGSAPCV